MYTKLADAVNKKLKRDWDTVEARARTSAAKLRSVTIYIWLESRFANKAINLFVQSCNEEVF